MIIILIIIFVIAFLQAYFDIIIDFKKEYGVIWYSYKDKRDGIVLWGSKY